MVFPEDSAAPAHIANESHKLHAISTALNVTDPTIWVFVAMSLGSVFAQLADQPLMQRVFSTPDPKQARNSVLFSTALAFPSAVVFFFIGTALFAYYQVHANRLTSISSDAIFPFFIVNELPHGVIGLIIAGLFAASMGSLSSILNSAATIFVTDGYRLLRADSSDRQRVWMARAATLVFGAAASGMAAYIAHLGVPSLWDQFLKLMALIGGGLPGVFALGLLSKRANPPGVIIGALGSVLVTWYVQTYTTINVFAHVFVAVFACILIGYLASLCFKGARRRASQRANGLDAQEADASLRSMLPGMWASCISSSISSSGRCAAVLRRAA